MKRKMPPLLRWTLDKLGRRLAGLFRPGITKANIYSDYKMQIQVDGEVLGMAQVNVKIIPKALNVIAGSQNVI